MQWGHLNYIMGFLSQLVFFDFLHFVFINIYICSFVLKGLIIYWGGGVGVGDPVYVLLYLYPPLPPFFFRKEVVHEMKW